MTSPSDITERRRKARAQASGRRRKNKQNKIGTTPALFTLNKPVAAAAGSSGK
jgi:hypothetical protein